MLTRCPKIALSVKDIAEMVKRDPTLREPFDIDFIRLGEMIKTRFGNTRTVSPPEPTPHPNPPPHPQPPPR